MPALNTAVAAAAIAIAATTTHASVTASVTESSPPGLAPDARAWDIHVTLANDVSLPRYSVFGENVTSGTFLDPDPDQILFLPNGTLADTWFTGTGFAPNPIQPGAANPSVSFVDFTPTSFSAGVVDFRVPPGDGTYIISRIITTNDIDADLRVFLSTSVNPDGEFVTFQIPTPSTAALLPLAAGAAARRRRNS
jgi:hypothetical protein